MGCTLSRPLSVRPIPHVVSKTAIILVAVIVLAVQFALIVPATMHDEAFRHQEQLDAHMAMVNNPTQTTQAAFQREMELEQYHRTHEQFFRGVSYFGVLALFDCAGFYFWIRYGKRKSA
jgi:uncharacterized ion transporter superfamily protein YfcC